MITKLNTFYDILPWPEKIVDEESSLALTDGLNLVFDPDFAVSAERLEHAARMFGIRIGAPGKSVALRLNREVDGAEAWRMKVTPEAVTLEASAAPGMAYAVSALIQMLAVATTGGTGRFAGLNCGQVEDKPRFGWRGFMLDCARHFRSVATIKTVLRTMAHYRYNVFHWHLTDNEGWRTPSGLLPELSAAGELEDGSYSAEEIADVLALAKSLHIKVVPELDWPGHSRRLIKVSPGMGCSSGATDELCVGNPAVRERAAALLEEFMELFPDSTEIHLGGDEADTAHWQQCPECQGAMKRHGFTDIHELEHDFMMQLVNQVLAVGKTPIVWCDSGTYPRDVISQLWCSRGREATLANGNRVIESSCSCCYLDRRLDEAELQFTDYQNFSPIEDNYGFEPGAGCPQNAEQFLGVEACAWGGYLPERRLMAKILPRLPAVAEVAWGNPRHRIWSAFQTRAFRQQEAGCEKIW